MVNYAITSLCAYFLLSTVAHGSSMKVLSFNMRTMNAPDPCPCGCWEQRKGRVVRHINDESPDFIGTQEMTAAQKPQLDAELPSYQSFGRNAEGGRSPETNAIYYKSGKWSKIQDGTFWLSGTPDVPSNTWNMEYYRTAVWGRFKHNESGKTVCIFNTHYALPGLAKAQEQSSELISRKMAEICSSSDSLSILTGDLNAEPGASSIRYFLNKSPYPLSQTVSGGTWCGGSTESSCSGTKFDYVLMRKNVDDPSVCLTSSQILRTPYDGCYVSDHAVPSSTFCLSAPCYCKGNSAPAAAKPASAKNAEVETESPTTTEIPETESLTTTEIPETESPTTTDIPETESPTTEYPEIEAKESPEQPAMEAPEAIEVEQLPQETQNMEPTPPTTKYNEPENPTTEYPQQESPEDETPIEETPSTETPKPTYLTEDARLTEPAELPMTEPISEPASAEEPSTSIPACKPAKPVEKAKVVSYGEEAADNIKRSSPTTSLKATATSASLPVGALVVISATAFCVVLLMIGAFFHRRKDFKNRNATGQSKSGNSTPPQPDEFVTTPTQGTCIYERNTINHSILLTPGETAAIL